jgi:hypothetical protein
VSSFVGRFATLADDTGPEAWMLVFGASLVANVRSQVRVESATREGSDEPENCGYVTV